MFQMTSARLRQLVAGLLIRKHEYDSGPLHLRLMVDQVALGQAFTRIFLYSPDNIIPSVLHALLSLLMRRTGGKRLERCKEKYFHVYVLKG
jgi:hypothetical protein